MTGSLPRRRLSRPRSGRFSRKSIQRHRIDGDASIPNDQMQVRPGDAARRADASDDLSTLDRVALGDELARKVKVGAR